MIHLLQRLRKRVRVRWELKWEDAWIGAFWRRERARHSDIMHLWLIIPPLSWPGLPLHFKWRIKQLPEQKILVCFLNQRSVEMARVSVGLSDPSLRRIERFSTVSINNLAYKVLDYELIRRKGIVERLDVTLHERAAESKLPTTPFGIAADRIEHARQTSPYITTTIGGPLAELRPRVRARRFSSWRDWRRAHAAE